MWTSPSNLYVCQIPHYDGRGGWLRLDFMRLRWKLQNGCLLARLKGCQKNNLPIREFQRIVMVIDLVLIDLF